MDRECVEVLVQALEGFVVRAGRLGCLSLFLSLLSFLLFWLDEGVFCMIGDGSDC